MCNDKLEDTSLINFNFNLIMIAFFVYLLANFPNDIRYVVFSLKIKKT